MTSNNLHEKYSNYHYCIVRECKNTSIKTPGKLWIRVPREINIRNTWLRLAQRDPESLSTTSQIHFCEDHFDLENDMENYTQYKIMGSVKRIQMKPGCVPSKFVIQSYKKRKLSPTPDQLKHAYKKSLVMPILEDNKQVCSMEISKSSFHQGACEIQGRQGNKIALKMRCCVPFCKNTSDNVSTSDGERKGISFHGFPSEVHLCAAWLRALGQQHNLPDSAVVCSQHFLNDDIYETESGLRKIRIGAIPSTVQVCMICLDTDSKLLLMSKHKLEEAYEKLTGQSLCDQGNLKHTLCVQCAQRLMNFSRFRDKSLRARALMMDLVEKHEFITREHIQMVNRTKHQLNSNMVLTTLGPDHCDLHILGHPSEDKQAELEETCIMKFERNDESMWVDEDMVIKNEADNVIDFVQDPLKYETAFFQCTHCLEEFVHEHAYMHHMSMHRQNGDGECKMSQVCKPHTAVSSSSAHSSLITDNKQADSSPSAHSAQTLVAPLPASLQVLHCFKNVIDMQCSLQKSSHTEESGFICDICRIVFKKKSLLVKHLQTHADVKRFTCEVCQHKCKYQSDLKTHMRTHTGERPYSCKLCDYKSTTNSHLVTHMRTHTGIKPFTCKSCNYKCSRNSDLVRHMRTHTGMKPFSCKLCDYKCTQKSRLVTHMRTHTGLKPFSCELCDYKCTTNSTLVTHMRTHTGEKPYTCEICEYKCAHRTSLMYHNIKTHTATGEKPSSCSSLKMRCCVPFCKNTFDNVSTSEGEGKGISFHGFPSEGHLRAAWLRALGQQDNLPDSAVVCSQHFLNDDLHETESGLWQIRTGAIPSTVQVCMICLDTDSKLVLMSKHKLEEAYEKLTGQPLCDQGNLKQTLCVQCSQRLMNFSRFRDKSLRARALMMDLVEKHELITREHIQMVNRTKHQLNCNMVLTTLGPDHCDLHILEHPSEDKQKELEETSIIKFERNEESIWVDEDLQMKNEADNNLIYLVQDPLKYESVLFQCTRCLEEFVHEHAYMQHMSMHRQDGDGECETSQVCKPHAAVSSSSAHSSLITENRQADPSPSAHSAQTSVAPLPASLATNNEIKVSPTQEADSKVSCRYNRLTHYDVKLYDVFSKKAVPRQDGKVVRSCVNQNMASKDISYQATSDNEVSTTEYVDPVANTVEACVSKTVQSKTDCLKNVIDMQCSLQSSSQTEERGYICDICQKVFKGKRLLFKHLKTHAEVRWFTCEICQHKCKYPSQLKQHMIIHTGERPFLCKICDHKCTRNSDLVVHMRTHIDIKPFSCTLCNYNCKRNGNLVRHMRTHTGDKPFACKLCDYKCTQHNSLVTHIRTHTGEKPFSCNVCNYECTSNSNILKHMRTHTGIKPFSCNLCDHKYTRNSDLVVHMRTHSGEKPFSCMLCNYKCARNSNLVTHMRTHTGEKPYLCEICEYKCAQRSSLMYHMRTHTATGEKPSSCS
ncbi:zinc finger protein 845-like [Maniola hyperantus]|uniref:zinc finger protein 845-like n=1 Tax=Aphantopus hyperantus TaxID=2795564 RepID=UPI00374A1196